MSNSSADRFPDLLQLPSGLKLQISMTYPSGERSGGKKLAVCSHAWSRVGGNINDPVLRSLVKPLCSRLGYHVLLFSARGVGSSSGWASFTGFQEALDLQELVAYAVEKLGGVEDLVLAGYSNGCLSTSLHPPLPPPTRTSYILLSYPLDVRHWLTAFNSRKYQKGLEDLVRHPDSRVLVIYSDRDEFTYIASYARWVANLEAIAAEPSKDATGREEEGEEPASRPSEHHPDGPRMQAVCIDGANHYWRGGDLTRMLAAVEGFLKTR